MIRAILGLIKGLVVGGGLGYGLYRAGLGGEGTVMTYLACAVAGALVGVIAGRPPWRSDTIWTPVVKALFGAMIGAGFAALGLHLLPSITLVSHPELTLGTKDASFLAAAVAVIYGAFVEVDDGGAADQAKNKQK